MKRLLHLPEEISFETGAAMMLQGLTAAYLLRRTYRVQSGDTVLIHAAAGGVGLIACQWAKALGATVIGTVGSEAKAEIARAHGCDHVIDYRCGDFSAKVREITAGEGVPVVYDGVGQATFNGSLDCLRPAVHSCEPASCRPGSVSLPARKRLGNRRAYPVGCRTGAACAGRAFPRLAGARCAPQYAGR